MQRTLNTLDRRIRAEIRTLRAAGISLNAIAAALNRRGIPGLQGGRWYGATVQRALQASNANATGLQACRTQQDSEGLESLPLR